MAIKLEGPLTKWTNVVQGWQFRWFVLDDNAGLLSYFTSKDKIMKGARRGCLRLRGAKIGIDDEDDSTFTITSDHKTFHFQARDSNERSSWVKALEETIIMHSQGLPPNVDLSASNEEELNIRMQEAEAYFRILTQQVKNLESSINNAATVTPERNTILKDSLTHMIESIGTTIELLHNTKTSLTKKVPVPVMNKAQTNGQIPETVSNDESKDSIVPSIQTDLISQELQNGDSDDSSHIKALNENEENAEKMSPEMDNELSQTMEDNDNTNYIPLAAPLTSFASSDEEEFFDAEDDIGMIDVDDLEGSIKAEIAKAEAQPALGNLMESEGPILDLNTLGRLKKSPSGSVASDQIAEITPGDSEYDVEDDPFEGGSDDFSSHGSVITHLLSQVKIGMDLTKVTLPTFILERRSLLEMYADFFAHPDLFKGIPDLSDPGDRMIQVVKWYLSSFHAGRKGSVAKKPYNPILGEVFQCFYDLTDEGIDRHASENLTLDGPIPWATKDDVTFLAEQVSHHPPISAFYAECAKKRICFNSSIWTKSKFLGLSIGVHMVGTGNLYVSDYNEEYVMTFPNGYGRSILTVPWVEMGGRTEITCAASGYSATMEFLTKPFYGGKKNRMTAEVFAPNQKKAFMTINGEWNGVMYSKFDGQKDQEVLVDTFTMPTIQKKVRLISKQEEFESRHMWESVTKALKINDIDVATAGKHKLEEKQRSDARIRKDTNTKWVNRMFDEFDEDSPDTRHFVYRQPLYKRLGLPKPGQQQNQD